MQIEKKFHPEKPKNPYIGTLWFGGLSIFLLFNVIKGFLNIEKYGVDKVIILTVCVIPCVIFFIYLIFLTTIVCEYILFTKESVIGKNRFKYIKGEILFEEIEEIYVKGKSYFVHIKDKHGKEIQISGLGEYIEEVMNTIIAKAVNCKRIDIGFLKTRFSNIIQYEKGQIAK